MRPPVLFPLFAPVRSLKGVGAKVAPLIEALAGERVRDLLFLLPQSVVSRPRRKVAGIATGRSGDLRAGDPRASTAATARPAVAHHGARSDELRLARVVQGLRSAPGARPSAWRRARGERPAGTLRRRAADRPSGLSRRDRRGHPRTGADLSGDRRLADQDGAAAGARSLGQGARAAGVAGCRLDRSPGVAALARGAGAAARADHRRRPRPRRAGAPTAGVRRAARSPVGAGPAQAEPSAGACPGDRRQRPRSAAARRPALRAHGRPGAGAARDRRRSRFRRADGSANPGRRRRGQDRGRSHRHGRGGGGRRPSGADGADRDPRPPAFRDDRRAAGRTGRRSHPAHRPRPGPGARGQARSRWRAAAPPSQSAHMPSSRRTSPSTACAWR